MANLDQLYSPPKAPSELPNAPAYDVNDALVRAEFGGIWIRVLAQVIDQVVIAVLGFAIGAVDGIARASAGGAQPEAASTVATFGASLIASIALFTFSEGIGGATLGKTICGLEVRKERLEPCTLGAGLVRALGLYFDLMICGIPGITSIQGSRLKQRYGDKWAHTIVVRSRSVPPVARNTRATGIAIGVAAWTVVSIVPVVAAWIF